jgi:hypothetical protein
MELIFRKKSKQRKDERKINLETVAALRVSTLWQCTECRGGASQEGEDLSLCPIFVTHCRPEFALLVIRKQNLNKEMIRF